MCHRYPTRCVERRARLGGAASVQARDLDGPDVHGGPFERPTAPQARGAAHLRPAEPHRRARPPLRPADARRLRSVRVRGRLQFALPTINRGGRSVIRQIRFAQCADLGFADIGQRTKDRLDPPPPPKKRSRRLLRLTLRHRHYYSSSHRASLFAPSRAAAMAAAEAHSSAAETRRPAGVAAGDRAVSACRPRTLAAGTPRRRRGRSKVGPGRHGRTTCRKASCPRHLLLRPQTAGHPPPHHPPHRPSPRSFLRLRRSRRNPSCARVKCSTSSKGPCLSMRTSRCTARRRDAAANHDGKARRGRGGHDAIDHFERRHNPNKVRAPAGRQVAWPQGPAWRSAAAAQRAREPELHARRLRSRAGGRAQRSVWRCIGRGCSRRPRGSVSSCRQSSISKCLGSRGAARRRTRRVGESGLSSRDLARHIHFRVSCAFSLSYFCAFLKS